MSVPTEMVLTDRSTTLVPPHCRIDVRVGLDICSIGMLNRTDVLPIAGGIVRMKEVMRCLHRTPGCEIGRASCRERMKNAGVVKGWDKKEMNNTKQSKRP